MVVVHDSDSAQVSEKPWRAVVGQSQKKESREDVSRSSSSGISSLHSKGKMLMVARSEGVCEGSVVATHLEGMLTVHCIIIFI